MASENQKRGKGGRKRRRVDAIGFSRDCLIGGKGKVLGRQTATARGEERQV